MIMYRNIPDIAVVGAGPAGLACAARLAEHGLQVQVYDKGRRPGGRTSLREDAGLLFEHGAPGESTLVASLVARVPAIQRARVTALERTHGCWLLQIDGTPLRSRHRGVVLAVPAPQAVALWPPLSAPLRQVIMRPVLTALLGLPGPLNRAWDRITFAGGSLAEARRQAVVRPGAPETWVLHASPGFSQDNLECETDGVARHLWRCFRDALSLDFSVPSFLRGHRWRHALTVEPLGRSCWYDPQLELGVCGDWCLGDNVAAALASGRTLADRMLGIAERPPRISLSLRDGPV